MERAQREREALETLRELQEGGMSLDDIREELLTRGYSYDEADALIDDGVLPPEREDYWTPYVIPQAPNRIGGWLVLPAVGLVLTPVWLLRNIEDNQAALNAHDLPLIEETYPGVTFLVKAEIVTAGALVAACVVAAWFFFRKSRHAPVVMITLFALQAVIAIVDHAAVAAVVEAEFVTGELIGALVAAAIWIPYFLKSERVRNTFVY